MKGQTQMSSLDRAVNVLSLFSGCSMDRVAFDRAGIPVNQYYASEIDVGVYADGGTYYRMDYSGYGLWTTTLRSNYFMYCSEITYFDFVAQDVYGNYDELLVW